MKQERKDTTTRDIAVFSLSAVLVVVALVIFFTRDDTAFKPQIGYVGDQELDDAQPGDAPQIDLEEVKRRIIENPDIIIVDVQEREGYLAQHIPGSINIPFEELENRKREIPKNKEVIISCIGNDVLPCALSTRAGRTLGQNGYQNILDYRGGVTEWKEAGLPLITNQEILIPTTSVDDLHIKIQDREDIIVLDVRDLSDFLEGHIPTAQHAEFTKISDEIIRIPKHKHVYVYDSTGARSKLYVDELVRNGYILVVDVVDGFNAWQSKGYAEETD